MYNFSFHTYVILMFEISYIGAPDLFSDTKLISGMIHFANITGNHLSHTCFFFLAPDNS